MANETTQWTLPFLDELGSTSSHKSQPTGRKAALIILNQPFSFRLLECLWRSASWKACADGGANRLHDLLAGLGLLSSVAENGYLPDLIKGDFDSLRPDVKEFYTSKNVKIVPDDDQDSTDLMKCVSSLLDKEKQSGDDQHDIVLLGGLSGRLDQTIHTLSYLQKLRKSRKRVFAITDESVAWVLDSGQHTIEINHGVLGQTCGLLPLGIESTVLTTVGLRWNLTEEESSFDGLISTSNHLLPEERIVRIQTTKPIVFTAEIRTASIY